MQALAEEVEAGQQRLAQADKHADAQEARISHLEQQYDSAGSVYVTVSSSSCHAHSLWS